MDFDSKMASRRRNAGPGTRSKAVVFGDTTNKTQNAQSTLRSGSRSSRHINLPFKKPLKAAMSSDSAQALPLQSRSIKSIRLPTRGAKSHSAEPKWLNMTPIEWIDDLNFKAKVAEDLARGNNPFISGGRMAKAAQSSESALLPGDVRHCDKFAIGGNHLQGHTRSHIASFMPSEYLDSLPNDIVSILSKVNPAAMPLFWDFSSVPQSRTVDGIRLLTLAIEQQPNFLDMKPALSSIRDHFTFSHSRVTQNEQFDSLCDETASRLKSLLILLAKDGPGDDLGAPQSMQTTPSVSNVHPEQSRSSQGTSNKAAFQVHMTNWLRANWINPYPDEAVTHQLAFETGETPHVVNTWLVNARTRRWRPAILKSFDLKRPSEMLWEDSINLFEEKPLRPLNEETIASQGDSKRIRMA